MLVELVGVLGVVHGIFLIDPQLYEGTDCEMSGSTRFGNNPPNLHIFLIFYSSFRFPFSCSMSDDGQEKEYTLNFSVVFCLSEWSGPQLKNNLIGKLYSLPFSQARQLLSHFRNQREAASVKGKS